jgi:hypothetical protein
MQITQRWRLKRLRTTAETLQHKNAHNTELPSRANEAGAIFSLDLMVAFVVLLALVHLCMLNMNSSLGNISGMKGIGLEKNAAMLADSLVKNRDLQFPIYGAAKFDGIRKRVLSNEIDEGLLATANGTEEMPFAVKEISVAQKKGGMLRFEGGEAEGECIAVERLVVLNGEKSLLKVVVCADEGK